MRWRIGWMTVALLLVGAVRTAGQGVPEISAGAGLVVPAGGKQFEFPQPFTELGPGLNAALRWHIREVASVGVVLERARFRYTEPDPYEGITREGARRYVGLGASVRRYSRPRGTGPRGFLGVSMGLAFERFSRVEVCANDGQTEHWPCESFSDDRGAWAGGEVGVSLPTGSGFLVEFAATLSGVIMGWTSGIAGGSPSDDAGWVGFRVALAGALW